MNDVINKLKSVERKRGKIYKRLSVNGAKFMNIENFELNEEFKKAYDQMMLEILIYNKLEEFRKTRAIATAVEVCDMFINEMGMDEK